MDVLNIHQRLLAVTKELDEIRKNIKTDKDVFHKDKSTGKKFKTYSVITRDPIIKLITPLMVKHGISAVPSACEHERVGNMSIVKMKIQYFNADDPSNMVETTSYGYGIDTQDKGIGKAQTYAERYNYQKTFKLPTGDDIEDDSDEFKKDPIDEMQLIQLREICEGYSWNPDDTLKRMVEKLYKLKDIKELPAEYFNDAVKQLKNKWDAETKKVLKDKDE